MGLGAAYWPQVMRALEDVIPVYDRVNRLISAGRADRHRAAGVAGRLRPGDAVLDAGSGFGNMSRAALAERADVSLVLCDPLMPMLRRAAGLCGARACGVFERMPFADGSFDVVMCGYSLRDASDLRAAVSELHRVLRPGGRLVVVDLGKPDSALVRAGVAAYLRAAVPVIGLAAGGRRGLRFGELYGTFRRWPTVSGLRAVLGEKFARVEISTDLMGAAVMIAAHK